MMNTQSKKGQDGREKVSLPCSFGMSDDAPRKGTVTSLSVKRCFVRTKAWAKDGMELHVKLWLPEERWLPLRATVLYCMEKVGFELLFDNPTPGETEALRALVGAAQAGRLRAGDGLEVAEDELVALEVE